MYPYCIWNILCVQMDSQSGLCCICVLKCFFGCFLHWILVIVAALSKWHKIKLTTAAILFEGRNSLCLNSHLQACRGLLFDSKILHFGVKYFFQLSISAPIRDIELIFLIFVFFSPQNYPNAFLILCVLSCYFRYFCLGRWPVIVNQFLELEKPY